MAVVYNVVTVNSNYTCTSNDDVILVDASAGVVTVTLPSSVNGKFYIIKKIDSSSNHVTIQPGAGNLEGDPSWDLVQEYSVVKVMFDSDNNSWWIVGNNFYY